MGVYIDLPQVDNIMLVILVIYILYLNLLEKNKIFQYLISTFYKFLNSFSLKRIFSLAILQKKKERKVKKTNPPPTRFESTIFGYLPN